MKLILRKKENKLRVREKLPEGWEKFLAIESRGRLPVWTLLLASEEMRDILSGQIQKLSSFSKICFGCGYLCEVEYIIV